ncbi:MAG TPA: hypothetical protein VFL29_11785 [Candidatus Dormibacteraeota bacterium]|nr:hypothetical protein [Candidatus Dormibacteraeota bacterium]
MALTTACGGALFGNVPSPSPVTAESVRAAVDNSTMKNAHFRVTGKFIVQGQSLSVTGDGVLQKSPASAIEMTLTVQPTGGGRTLVVQEISVAGRDYSRVNSGKWTSAPESTNSSPTTPDTYVGEETIAGTVTWHARSTNSGKTYDIWVRESDGYIAYLQFTDASSVLTMTFDTYNQSPPITAP